MAKAPLSIPKGVVGKADDDDERDVEKRWGFYWDVAGMKKKLNKNKNKTKLKPRVVFEKYNGRSEIG